jgi:hypothetical protein
VTPTRFPRSAETLSISGRHRYLQSAREQIAILQHLQEREGSAVDLVMLESALRIAHGNEFDEANLDALFGEEAFLLRQMHELEWRPADQCNAQRRLVGRAACQSNDRYRSYQQTRQ